MAEIEKVLKIVTSNRKQIREDLIREFLKEEPGNKNETSKYYYYVESTSDNKDIYLKRPARLNKGMDFEVHAEGVLFENESVKGNLRRSSRPTHSTIFYDLKVKQIENNIEYAKVRILITKIYNCESIKDEEIESLNFDSGFKIELILKLIKWLFIEQDITYWNWSGRNKFYLYLCEI